jgi:hypothetical protein
MASLDRGTNPSYTFDPGPEILVQKNGRFKNSSNKGSIGKTARI